MENNTADSFSQKLSRARMAFGSGISRNVEFRKQQLRAIHRLISENEQLFVEALKSDFSKTETEVILYELEVVKNELIYQLENIDQYVQRRPVEKLGFAALDEPFLQYEPYGVVLIIGPWNYPVQLVLSPLVAAITAGNCALIKPSEVVENTDRLLSKLIPQYLNNECFHVVNGGPKETTELLQLRFDYIFFTGSPNVGRIVYQSAAKHLTPVTLELGGKSPLWIDETVEDLQVACRRLLWAKLINLGQTCVAPDYVITPKNFQNTLLDTLLEVMKEFCGPDPKTPGALSRMVNQRNYDRVSGLLKNTKGRIVFGGDTDAGERYISPTIVADVLPDDSLMTEEIFGPLLPVLAVKDVNEAIAYITSNEKPLTIYVFSGNEKTIDRFVAETSSGVFCANDAIINLLLDSLPFGGVGQSGMGAYHGKWSFETFSHMKGSLIRNYNKDIEELTKNRYLPFTKEKTDAMRKMIGKVLPP